MNKIIQINYNTFYNKMYIINNKHSFRNLHNTYVQFKNTFSASNYLSQVNKLFLLKNVKFPFIFKNKQGIAQLSMK